MTVGCADVSVRRAFWDAFRQKSHLLVHEGFCRVDPGVRRGSDEDSITGEIAKHAQEYLRSGPDWVEHYAVHEQAPEWLSDRRGNSRPRKDLAVECTSRALNRPCYAFEAKRLRTGDCTIGKYVGPDGVGCFAEGRYAPEAPEAAMLAYVQNKDMGYWKGELERSLPVSMHSACVIPQFPHEWQSSHERPDHSCLCLYHVFLDCR